MRTVQLDMSESMLFNIWVERHKFDEFLLNKKLQKLVKINFNIRTVSRYKLQIHIFIITKSADLLSYIIYNHHYTVWIGSFY